MDTRPSALLPRPWAGPATPARVAYTANSAQLTLPPGELPPWKESAVRRARIGVLDLITKSRSTSIWNRVMQPNFASIMPQVIAVWCEEMGHDITFVSYTGPEDIDEELPEDMDILFISAFTHAAQLSYAVSNYYRQRGVVTVLGGPHARAYPEDACKYFDYVLGFTTRSLLEDLLADFSRQRPTGVQLSAMGQPTQLPGIRERWPYIESLLAKGLGFKFVPALGSFGCPYTCSFCVDSTVDYRPLGNDQIREDLRFLVARMKHPRVGWHDPNFGVRFDETMATIEEAVPPGSVEFYAESSLSLLSESRLERFRANGFKALLPGIESWFDCGNKSKTRSLTGLEKVKQISEHVNTILRYVPYVQTNFVLGLDVDEGPEPFELTKTFLDLTPGAFPAYSLFSAFGRATPLNLELQRAGRVLPIPFHFLDNNRAMNIRPLNYDIADFYDHLIDLRRHSFSWPLIARRFRANSMLMARVLNVVRAVSSEGFGRIRYDRTIRGLIESDATVRPFLEGRSTRLPAFFLEQIQQDLGPWWQWLPKEALYHDADADLGESPEVPGRMSLGFAANLRPSESGQHLRANVHRDG